MQKFKKFTGDRQRPLVLDTRQNICTLEIAVEGADAEQVHKNEEIRNVVRLLLPSSSLASDGQRTLTIWRRFIQQFPLQPPYP